MFKIDQRVLTLHETLSSVLSGEIVPSVFDVEEVAAGSDTKWEPGAALLSYRLKRRTLRPSPLGAKPPARHLSFPPDGAPSHVWVDDMLKSGAVLAALPDTPSPKMALSEHAACGHARFWTNGLVAAASSFNESKTRRSLSSPNRTHFESNALFDSLPPFLPEGDAYGLEAADIDALIDAGVSVEIRKRPYGADERVGAARASRRAALCAREVSLTLDAAHRGVSPAVFASFYATRTDRRKPVAREDVEALITVSQLHTFTLDSLMEAHAKAPVLSERAYLRGVLSDVCHPVFERIRGLAAPKKGRSVLKLNMTPESVVFCPRLHDEGGRWTVKGAGFMPVSRDFLDGEPLLADFNAMLTSSVPEEAHSPDVSFVMHSLLLVAFSRALHGQDAAGVLWDYLTTSDRSAFPEAASRVRSKQTNATGFLSNLVANPEMREDSDLSKAVAEAVSDMDAVVRVGVLADDGGFAQPPDKAIFAKLVGLVTGVPLPDTRIFEPPASDTAASAASAASAEVETYHALEELKRLRSERLKRFD